MKNASSALEQLHSGIVVPEYSVTIPWLISEASLYRFIPKEHFSFSPAGWPRLTFTCLGVTAEFGFNFVSLPGGELVELQLSARDSPALVKTVNDWAVRLQMVLGEAERQSNNRFRWFDDRIVVDCLVTAGKDSIDGEWHAYGSLRIVNSAGWPGHWNNRNVHKSDASHQHIPKKIDFPHVVPENKRTHATSLTDDELILLDCLFNCDAPPAFLSREGWSELWRVSPHNLTNRKLRQAIKRLVSSGMLQMNRDNGRSHLSMTEMGGRAWEAERLPVWSRFAMHRFVLMKSGKTQHTIFAMTSQTRDEFWDIGLDIGYFPSTFGPIERSVRQNQSLIDWKPSSEIFVLNVELDGWDVRDFARQEYEERRTWWRGVRESEKFWGESPPGI